MPMQASASKPVTHREMRNIERAIRSADRCEWHQHSHTLVFSRKGVVIYTLREMYEVCHVDAAISTLVQVLGLQRTNSTSKYATEKNGRGAKAGVRVYELTPHTKKRVRQPA